MSDDNLPAIMEEMSSIEASMGTRDYWRNEGTQQRYRDLVGRKTSILSGADDSHDAADGPLIPILTMDQFKAQGGQGDYSAYLKLNRTAGDFVMSLPSGEQAGFVQAFEALPDDVGFAALAEISRDKPCPPLLTEADIAAIRTRPEGKLLADEWGGAAKLKFAIIRVRLWRIIDDLDERGAHRFQEWLDGLSVGAVTALYRRLVA